MQSGPASDAYGANLSPLSATGFSALTGVTEVPTLWNIEKRRLNEIMLAKEVVHGPVHNSKCYL